ncbi:MAG: hypothetical protein WC565_02540 [Parcubacteria group bacterium]
MPKVLVKKWIWIVIGIVLVAVMGYWIYAGRLSSRTVQPLSSSCDYEAWTASAPEERADCSTTWKTCKEPFGDTYGAEVQACNNAFDACYCAIYTRTAPQYNCTDYDLHNTDTLTGSYCHD